MYRPFLLSCGDIAPVKADVFTLLPRCLYQALVSECLLLVQSEEQFL